MPWSIDLLHTRKLMQRLLFLLHLVMQCVCEGRSFYVVRSRSKLSWSAGDLVQSIEMRLPVADTDPDPNLSCNGMARMRDFEILLQLQGLALWLKNEPGTQEFMVEQATESRTSLRSHLISMTLVAFLYHGDNSILQRSRKDKSTFGRHAAITVTCHAHFESMSNKCCCGQPGKGKTFTKIHCVWNQRGKTRISLNLGTSITKSSIQSRTEWPQLPLKSMGWRELNSWQNQAAVALTTVTIFTEQKERNQNKVITSD